MSTTLPVIRARVAALCEADPFRWTQTQSPFDHTLQATGTIDQTFRVTSIPGEVKAGFNFTEERTDRVTVFVARKLTATPHETYARLSEDVVELISAITHDGHESGLYFVPPDGRDAEITHEDGREFAVASLTVLVNYEANL